MARVICPFCLKPHDFISSLECPTYKQTVPAIYVKEYNRVQPLWLVTIGFSRHGKTTYLAALTLMLENMAMVWNGVFYRPLDQHTIDTIRQMRREAINGELPPPNPKAVPRPLLLNMYNLPESGSHCLVMYDVAGEIYDSLSEVQEYVTSIKEVATTWFLVSLEDLKEDQQGKTLPELFHVYLSGMEKLRIDLQGRNLIVIYTKADQAVSFPPSIKDYLKADPFQGLTRSSADISSSEEFSIGAYVEKMQDISNQLREYTRKRVSGGAAFISMVEANGLKLIFCATSALGQSPNSASNRLSVDALRYRVLDPFLWAIKLHTIKKSKQIGLIVDATAESRSIYDANLLPAVWENLSDHGEVTVYYLGETKPASQPGQNPPQAPLRLAHERLIGPILEQASPDTRFIVITTGKIHDLADFYSTPWRDRVLLVTMSEDHQQGWSNRLVHRTGDTATTLVDELLRLYI